MSGKVKPNLIVDKGGTTNSKQTPVCVVFPQLGWVLNIAKVLVSPCWGMEM